MRILGFLLFLAGLMLSFGNAEVFGASIGLILQDLPLAIMPDVSTLGTVLIWLGAGFFVLGLRRRNRVAANAPPPPSKWGRGT